jgi:hypothetical protein
MRILAVAALAVACSAHASDYADMAECKAWGVLIEQIARDRDSGTAQDAEAARVWSLVAADAGLPKPAMIRDFVDAAAAYQMLSVVYKRPDLTPDRARKEFVAACVKRLPQVD